LGYRYAGLESRNNVHVMSATLLKHAGINRHCGPHIDRLGICRKMETQRHYANDGVVLGIED
jgi:hypothetical protein